MKTNSNLSVRTSTPSADTRPAQHPALPGLSRLFRAGSVFAALTAALAFGPGRLDAVTVRPGRAVRRAAMARMEVQSVPVIISVPTTQPGAGAFQVTVQVDQVPVGGSSVQVTCSRPDLIASPSGSWPYTLEFPAGSSTSQSFTVTAGGVSSQTSVTFGSGPSGVDMGNPSNWTSSGTMTMTTSNPGTDQ